MTSPNESPSTIDELASAMLALIPAGARAHYHYDPADTEQVDGKLKAKYTGPVERPVTVEDWKQHLLGTSALVLSLTCDDGTTQVTTLDIDDYDVDVHALLKRIALLKLPIYVHRTKSGGARVVAFFDEAVPNDEARAVAAGMARRLGLDDRDKEGVVEIFPKRTNPDPAKLPKVLNMPFLGAMSGQRYDHRNTYSIIEPTSRVCGSMTVEDFLSTVRRLTAEQRETLTRARPPRQPRQSSQSDNAAATDAGGPDYAAAKCAAYAAEIAGLASGGNPVLNRRAFHMGTMVAREWIAREAVEQAFVVAIAGWEDQKRHHDTLSSALNAGMQHPHGPLAPREVDDLNERYALVITGGKAAILEEQEDTFRLLSLSAFDEWHAGEFVRVRDDKFEPLAKYWRKHPQRRKYSNIVFAPGREVPGVYNLWQGFAVEPRAGNCDLFLQHLLTNVCRGCEEHYKWVVGWFADIVQHPADKCGTSLMLRGKPGTGKTKVGEVVGSLLGPHYLLVSDPRYITGNFNSHLVSCLLLHGDEAFWAGDKTTEGKLRDLITGHDQLIEFKGKDPIKVRNHLRLFGTGEADWVVPASLSERRFTVLDVGEDHMQDADYFKAIDEQMANGGREALLDHLLRFDLKTVNLRQILHTAALAEQKVSSLKPEDAWWLDVLSRGELPWGCDAVNECPTGILTDRYCQHAQRSGARRRSSETKLGIFLRKAAPGLRRNQSGYWTVGSDRVVGPTYVFPSLAACRKEFEQMAHLAQRWSDDADPDGEACWQHEPGSGGGDDGGGPL